MDRRELLRQVLEGLSDHPRRAVASAMGVFWGTAVMVLLLSWGSGFREFIWEELGSFGQGAIYLAPGATSSGFPGYRKGRRIQFARSDAEAVEREVGDLVESLLAIHRTSGSTMVRVETDYRVRRMDLDAGDPRYPRSRGFTIAAGRAYDERDMARSRPVVVLGWDAAHELLEDGVRAVGRTLRIAGVTFEVIGVANPKGKTYFDISRPDDGLLLVPATSAEARLGFDEKAVTQLQIKPREGIPPELALKAVLTELGPRAGFHPDDSHAVRVNDTSELLDFVDPLYAGFLVYIGLMGTITLLIGGVGVANYHLATVAERTVEIAVARALGARRRVVRIQTVVEALVVALGAALSGAGAATALCVLLAGTLPADLVPIPIFSPLALMITALGLIAMAAVASLIPARRAARTEVARALRGEG